MQMRFFFIYFSAFFVVSNLFSMRIFPYLIGLLWHVETEQFYHVKFTECKIIKKKNIWRKMRISQFFDLIFGLNAGRHHCSISHSVFSLGPL